MSLRFLLLFLFIWCYLWGWWDCYIEPHWLVYILYVKGTLMKSLYITFSVSYTVLFTSNTVAFWQGNPAGVSIASLVTLQALTMLGRDVFWNILTTWKCKSGCHSWNLVKVYTKSYPLLVLYILLGCRFKFISTFDKHLAAWFSERELLQNNLCFDQKVSALKQQYRYRNIAMVLLVAVNIFPFSP